jgi:hypothetical protein
MESTELTLNKPDVPPLTLPAISPDATTFTLLHGEKTAQCDFRVPFVYDKQEDGSWKRVTFVYDELDEKAQEKAREWYMGSDYPYDDWWTSVYDWYADSKDSFTICKYEESPPHTRTDIRPYFEPGEVTSFNLYRREITVTGTFDLRKVVEAMCQQVAQSFLMQTPFTSTEKVRRWNRVLKWVDDGTIGNEFISIQQSSYGHAYQSWDAFCWQGDFDAPEWLIEFAKELEAWLDDDVKEIACEALTKLQAEYDGMFEEEYVAENIRINQYTFNEDGTRQ